MKSNDIIQKTHAEICEAMQKAIKENNTEGFYQALGDMSKLVEQNILQEVEEREENRTAERDTMILQSRGVRQLTSEEKKYYQKITEAMKSKNPKQALSNLDVVMPRTIIDTVLDDLRENHPLLSQIDFVPCSSAIDMIMSVTGYQMAKWGNLTAEVTQEVTSGFKKVQTNLLKLTAFLPVSKSMLDLGPRWLDRYVRGILYEALANGMEYGIISGTGDEEPVGMIRDVGIGVAVVNGKYPEKGAITVTDLGPETVGNLLSMIAVDDEGKYRMVNHVIMLVNPQDYLQKIMPATTVMAPDGTYRNNVMPYPMIILQSPSVPSRKAVLGIAKGYFAAAGAEKDGNIEYSDEYRFLEDERVYKIKTYGTGKPKDNAAFLVLDISGLKPMNFKVTSVTEEPSDNAELSDLKIGALELTEKFAPSTTTYTAATKNETNIVKAVPANGGAHVKVTVNDKEISNGSAAVWKQGSNTVTVEVTAANGTATKTYTVTVTKS